MKLITREMYVALTPPTKVVPWDLYRELLLRGLLVDTTEDPTLPTWNVTLLGALAIRVYELAFIAQGSIGP